MTSISFNETNKYRAIIKQDGKWIGLTEDALDVLRPMAENELNFETVLDTVLDSATKVIPTNMGFCLRRYLISESGQTIPTPISILMTKTTWRYILNSVRDYFKDPSGYCKQTLKQPPVNDIDGMEIMRRHLGRDRYVVHSHLNGENKFHFRQMGVDGQFVKGLSLNSQQWYKLSKCNEEVQKCLSSQDVFIRHLGAGRNLTVKMHMASRIIHIRQYWKPNDSSPLPTKEGIALTVEEWCKLTEWFDIPIRIEGWKPCIERDDHANQFGCLECPECTPW